MTHAFSDADLAAFMDGTLDDETLIAAIEAAINADPALAERAEALASEEDDTAAAVRAAFAPVLVAPVPERLLPAATPPTAAPRPLPVPANDTSGNWRWPQWAAMAASLFLGVVIGGPLLTGKSEDAAGGSLVLASADVDAMLDTAPSGQAVDLAALGTGEVVLTFRNADGQLCRQFMIQSDGATSDALACAAGDAGWQIEAYGRRPAPAGEMKLAGGDAAPGVVAAVDAIIASDPLLGADEAAELAKQ